MGILPGVRKRRREGGKGFKEAEVADYISDDVVSDGHDHGRDLRRPRQLQPGIGRGRSGRGRR